MTVRAARVQFQQLAIYAREYENALIVTPHRPNYVPRYRRSNKEASEALDALDETQQQLDAMVQYSVKVEGLVRATKAWLDALERLTQYHEGQDGDAQWQPGMSEEHAQLCSDLCDAEQRMRLEGQFLVS